MKISNRQFAKNLYVALSEVKAEEQSQVLKNFVEMVYKKRKLSQMDRIIEEYITYEKEMKGEIAVTVTTVSELSSEMKNILENKFGKSVHITEKVDRNIFGGIILQTKNTIYDASLKTSIDQLKQSLN